MITWAVTNDDSEAARKATAWANIKPADVRRIWRTLANQYKNARPGERPCGPRQAEVTVDALYSVANWLRDEGEIPSDAVLPPTKWRAKLKREPCLSSRGRCHQQADLAGNDHVGEDGRLAQGQPEDDEVDDRRVEPGDGIEQVSHDNLPAAKGT